MGDRSPLLQLGCARLLTSLDAGPLHICFVLKYSLSVSAVYLLAGLLQSNGAGSCAALFMRLACCMSVGLYHNQLHYTFTYMGV